MPDDKFPEKTCLIDRLVTHDRFIAAVLAGAKTQQRRAGVYGYPGESFKLEGIAFVISSLRSQSLESMTESDAKREGYASLKAYRELILRMHQGMTWDGKMKVWVHEFERESV
jgi:hypothetical protein